MTPEHESAYQAAIDLRSDGQPAFAWLVHVATTVPNVTLRMRADATWFLAINMMDMVVMPLTGIGRIPSVSASIPGNLQNDLRHDIVDIVQAGQQIARERGREYISSTSIFQATEQLLPKLRINELKLWGRLPVQRTR